MATLLCRYRYDPLDRLISSTQAEQTSVRRFYQKSHLATEIQGQISHTIFQHEDLLLAQQQRDGITAKTTLIITDQQRSVLQAVGVPEDQSTAYTAYGHRPAESGLSSLLGFNGERRDSMTGHYLLGNGYRAFNPVLMKFNSPDSLSPFAEGGLNGYAFCLGDPVNRVDPTGHTPNVVKSILRSIGVMKKARPKILLTTPRYGPPGKPATNLRKIDTNVYSFEEAKKSGGSRLTIHAHGSNQLENGYHPVISGNRLLTPHELNQAAQKAGINYGDYRDIRLLICHSADGGTNSFASQFSSLTGKPVKGFLSDVASRGDAKYILNLMTDNSKKIRLLPNGLHHIESGIKVHKTNPFKKDSPFFTHWSYQPVTYVNS